MGRLKIFFFTKNLKIFFTGNIVLFDINLSQASSLPILEIYGNGRVDNILGEACTYLFYIDGIFRWEA